MNISGTGGLPFMTNHCQKHACGITPDFVQIPTGKLCNLTSPREVKSILVQGTLSLFSGGELTIAEELSIQGGDADLTVAAINTLTTRDMVMVSPIVGTLTIEGTVNVENVFRLENSGNANVKGSLNVGAVTLPAP